MIICSWCQTIIKAEGCDNSHGICLECKDQLLKEYKELVENRQVERCLSVRNKVTSAKGVRT